MTATVHPLFSKNSAKAGAALHPLVVELRNSTLEVLDELVRRMFDSADDTLFEMGERASNDAERRRCFDAMRVLRLDRAKVAREFAAAFGRGFAPAESAQAQIEAFDLDNLSMQPTDELEQKIALNNMAARAADLFKQAIWEVEQRLAQAAAAQQVPIATDALGPQRICDAFGAGTAVLETEFQVKLVVFKLFERVVISNLERVYRIALEIFARHGIGARRPIATPRPEPGRAAAVDQLVETLRQSGIDPGGMGHEASPLAGELTGLLQSLLGAASAPAVQATNQRLSLAGRMFDELLSETSLPDPLRQTFEQLRYPVYKTALLDRNFFADAAHPVRRLVNEIAELAGSAPYVTSAYERLRDTLAAINAHAARLRTQTADSMSAPVSSAEIDTFLQQMREQARTRREALVMRVRQHVAQELEVEILGRQLPPGVLRLLRSGLGPLMAVRLLRSGRSSPAYREAHSLIGRLLLSLEFEPPANGEVLQSRETLLNAVVTALADVGMREDKIESLLEGLSEVYRLLDQAPAAANDPAEPLSAQEEQLLKSDIDLGAPQAPERSGAEPPAALAEPAEDGLPRVTVMELLNRILMPESWFRVHDAAHGQTRWLKLSSFYTQQDSITFTGFDESNRFSLRASVFAEDLANGHSEPINPDPPAREALEQLRRVFKAQRL